MRNLLTRKNSVDYKLPKRMASHHKRKVLTTVPMEGEIISGFHSVRLALESGKRTFYRIYYCANSTRVTSDLLELADMKDITTIPVSWKILDQLSKSAPHKGVCADVSPLIPESGDKLANTLSEHQRSKLWLLMCSIADPQNLGAIIRTSYFLGVEHIFTTSVHDASTSSSSLTPSVSRSSAGCLEIFQPKVIYNPDTFLQRLSDLNWRIIGATSGGDNSKVESETYSQCNKILVVGNEGSGLPASITKYCDDLLQLQPGRKLHHGVDSLNVSVATALLLQKLLDP